jgi:hypothetical protein
MKNEELIDRIFEMFPEVKDSRIVTRKQIIEATGAKHNVIPQWMDRRRVGRGTYSIDPLGSMSLKSVDPVQTASPVVDQIFDSFTPKKDMIPVKDPNFVPFGNYKDVEQVIASGMFYPTYIVGPTGNGKSTMVEQICAKNKRGLIRVNLNMMSDEDQLIGTKTLQNGNIEIVEGPVLIAMRTGSILLCDEIDAGSANTLLCLQPILEGKPYYFKLNNEIIHPAPGFNIIATANTKGKGSDDGRYIGTNVLNEAFLERFAVTFEQNYPDAKVEKKIVERLMDSFNCINPCFADNLVRWAEAVRRTFDDGGVDETITTRRISHIIRAYSIFRNEVKAIELCCNRFDVNTKSAFIDLYTKVAEVPVVEQEVNQPNYSTEVAF